MTDREQWLQWRKKGIGASDIPIIMGMTSWSSPTQLWREKRGEGDSDEPTDRMIFGIEAEDAVSRMVAARMNWELDTSEGTEHPEHPEHRCTPDRIRIVDPGTALMSTLTATPRLDRELVEIKICWQDYHKHWGDEGPAIPHKQPGGNVPAHYHAQVNWQLYVTGLQKGWLAGMICGDLKVYPVERDPALIAVMVQYANDFWECVQTGKQPWDPTENRSKELTQQHPQATEDTPLNLPDLEDAARAYSEASDDFTVAKKRKQAARNELQAAMGDHSKANAGAYKVAWSNRKGRVTLDSKRLKEDHPALYEEYTKVSPPTRAMRVTPPKVLP